MPIVYIVGITMRVTFLLCGLLQLMVYSKHGLPLATLFSESIMNYYILKLSVIVIALSIMRQQITDMQYYKVL